MTDQIKYSNKLRDNHVLIIGGSGGIGYGVAEACLELGCTVIISSSSASRIAASISSLQKTYPSARSRIYGHACDLGNPETLESNVVSLFEEATQESNGKLDHVVYTAGDALSIAALEKVTLEQIQQAGMVRFNAPLIVAREAAKYLKKSYTSSYTITTGAVSEKPHEGWAVIGSYAGGHHTMARGLALDMKPIRVNAVSPGAVDTTLWKMPDEEKKEMFKKLEAKMTTGRVGQVEDVAEAYLYCMKDRNLTGSVISTNGGALLI
ncbi:short chain dehydrogenase [Glonium stellatum]|uniref:Short chain dehydrogenase n=1 Tax=Glonium stellatum TaxID=574774 RepID=A0A8E2JLV2_9PEZI|nr:short chain dehydrogenase [Glonium stellatum]